MILTEQNINPRKINRLVGKPLRMDWKKPKTIGGPGLFLKSFKNKTCEVEIVPINSKCNFEKRTDGLLVHTNFSNRRTLIPIPKQDIIEIKIIRGEEKISPIAPYPMWFLLKLGVSILHARYFSSRKREYSIEPMELKLKTVDYDIDFVGNGFDFERQLNFLENMGIKDKIIVKKNGTR